MKGVFVRYISHEIRTPLNTVFLGLDYLKNELNKLDALPHIIIETADEIKDSCGIGLQLINEMLIYDKMEEGLLKLDSTDVPALDFVQGVVHSFQIQVLSIIK